MFSQEIFSKRFTELRKTAGLSQLQISKILGISRPAISMIERGERAVSIEVLCLLSEYYNVSTDYLVGLSDNPNRS